MLAAMEDGMTGAYRELYAQHISGMLKLVGALQTRTVQPDVGAHERGPAHAGQRRRRRTPPRPAMAVAGRGLIPSP
ncbi:hypothetical protein SAMN05216184_1103 [Georgenia satyanarayanai]|uniref:Uncharacterized protein n=1 Tax=Georgenia satyanarayanai TaxID=860221 RepID=A0A2Y9AJM7_9MICO|nr:hypothetical protein [Georgenia satyanarayanai]PYF98866.1 hypothetical protein A8987_1103 [Georgenia satyanarayanai]SSA44714.1 hypothetical protein SAMN05216184_1103 [Georgenia satyanarayanai]